MNNNGKKNCHFVLYLDSLEGVVGRWTWGGTGRVACVPPSPPFRKNGNGHDVHSLGHAP